MKIFQASYVSRARDCINTSDIQNIVNVSQRNNQIFDLTGCLMFSGRHFVQILEGNFSDVSDVLKSISLDQRHTNMRIFSGHQTSLRAYPQWSMEFLHNPDADTRMEILLNPKNKELPNTELLEFMTGVKFDYFGSPQNSDRKVR